MNLLADLKAIVQQQGTDKTYWIALSGGLDSTVLIHLCHQLHKEQSIRFHAIHVNHGLSPHAGEWADHCLKLAGQCDIPIEIMNIKLEKQAGDSLEALARQKRYAVFAEQMQSGDVLLTAHHQDDQAETLMLQLLRGAGLKGLSAMPAKKAFASGLHVRPLLNIPRKALQTHSIENNLSWVDDESNNDTTLARNFLRHHVMPVMAQQAPKANEMLTRSAAHLAEAQALLEEYADSLLQKVTGNKEGTLSVSGLTKYSSSQQKLMLRRWIDRAGFSLPSTKKIETILNDALTAAQDRFPCIEWDNVEVRRYRDDLYIMRQLPQHDISACYTWQLDQVLHVDGVGSLISENIFNREIFSDIATVEVRFRQGGEVIDLPKRGRISLKNLMQELAIEPWKRDKTPLVVISGSIKSFVFI